MRGRAWWVAGALLVVVLVVPYVAADRESLVLDEALREERGGDYVGLSDGITHYELGGPAGGQLVVLVHGGTIPLYAWDAQVPALVDAGFRVLRYTHYGRGYSDRPRVDYDRRLYQRQLNELLDALGVEGSFHIVGVSFGAATAATFLLENPERIDKAVFIAPVVDYSEGRPLFDLARVPVLSNWFVRVFAVRKTIERATGFFEEADAPPRYAARFVEQTRIEGFERALLSFSRTDALRDYSDTYAALGDHPKALMWGARDGEIPRHHVETLRETLENVTYLEIAEAGHGVTVEAAPEVNAHLLQFLTQ
jgi:pimeloyl-ACP methyl ester carboxylesterase